MKLVLLFVGVVVSLASRGSQHLTGDELVNYLNTHQDHFKATNYKWTAAEMKAKAMDKKYVSAGDTPIAPKIDWIRDEEIPESFDARDKWKNCASVGHIRDQSQCGSCWAFGAAQVMTDRTCIHSKGLVKANVSVEDILSCCSSWNQECGSCSGGWPYNAFNYWNSVGVVTGGDYGTNDGCMPYVISPCGWHNGVNYGSCPPDEVATPKCAPQCRDGYSKTYQTDKTFGTPAYRIQPQSAVDIQKEIMTNGPVTNCFDLYQDFYHYKSGVYVYSAGDYVGGHCVKMLGWGTENGIPYWLVANSWDTDFGEKGFFRIIRGINECNFEEYVFGALPQY